MTENHQISSIVEKYHNEPLTSLVDFWWLLIANFSISYIWARLSYKNYRYRLTDLALEKELGVISKKYVSIPYDKIQNVDIYRGF